MLSSIPSCLTVWPGCLLWGVKSHWFTILWDHSSDSQTITLNLHPTASGYKRELGSWIQCSWMHKTICLYNEKGCLRLRGGYARAIDRYWKKSVRCTLQISVLFKSILYQSTAIRHKGIDTVMYHAYPVVYVWILVLAEIRCLFMPNFWFPGCWKEWLQIAIYQYDKHIKALQRTLFWLIYYDLI